MNDRWIKYRSKTFPEKHYYFNPYSGLAVWDLNDVMPLSMTNQSNRPHAPHESFQNMNSFSPNAIPFQNGFPPFAPFWVNQPVCMMPVPVPVAQKENTSNFCVQSTSVPLSNRFKNFTVTRDLSTLKNNDGNNLASNRESSDIDLGVQKNNNETIDLRSKLNVQSNTMDFDLKVKDTKSNIIEDAPQLRESISKPNIIESPELVVKNVYKDDHTNDMLQVDVTCLKKWAKPCMRTEMWFIVVDMNILLDRIEYIEKIVKSDPNCRLMVPYAVLCEVNNISSMTNCQVRVRLARKVNRFLAREMATRRTVIGQTATENPSRCLSDAILHCCQQLLAQNCFVILISNEEQLRKKSLNFGIHSFSMSEIESYVDKQQQFKPCQKLKKSDKRMKFSTMKVNDYLRKQENIAQSSRNISKSDINGFAKEIATNKNSVHVNHKNNYLDKNMKEIQVRKGRKRQISIFQYTETDNISKKSINGITKEIDNNRNSVHVNHNNNYLDKNMKEIQVRNGRKRQISISQNTETHNVSKKSINGITKEIDNNRNSVHVNHNNNYLDKNMKEIRVQNGRKRQILIFQNTDIDNKFLKLDIKNKASGENYSKEVDVNLNEITFDLSFQSMVEKYNGREDNDVEIQNQDRQTIDKVHRNNENTVNHKRTRKEAIGDSPRNLKTNTNKSITKTTKRITEKDKEMKLYLRSNIHQLANRLSQIMINALMDILKEKHKRLHISPPQTRKLPNLTDAIKVHFRKHECVKEAADKLSTYFQCCSSEEGTIRENLKPNRFIKLVLRSCSLLLHLREVEAKEILEMPLALLKKMLDEITNYTTVTNQIAVDQNVSANDLKITQAKTNNNSVADKSKSDVSEPKNVSTTDNNKIQQTIIRTLGNDLMSVMFNKDKKILLNNKNLKITKQKDSSGFVKNLKSVKLTDSKNIIITVIKNDNDKTKEQNESLYSKNDNTTNKLTIESLDLKKNEDVVSAEEIYDREEHMDLDILNYSPMPLEMVENDVSFEDECVHNNDVNKNEYDQNTVEVLKENIMENIGSKHGTTKHFNSFNSAATKVNDIEPDLDYIVHNKKVCNTELNLTDKNIITIDKKDVDIEMQCVENVNSGNNGDEDEESVKSTNESNSHATVVTNRIDSGFLSPDDIQNYKSNGLETMVESDLKDIKVEQSSLNDIPTHINGTHPDSTLRNHDTIENILSEPVDSVKYNIESSQTNIEILKLNDQNILTNIDNETDDVVVSATDIKQHEFEVMQANSSTSLFDRDENIMITDLEKCVKDSCKTTMNDTLLSDPTFNTNSDYLLTNYLEKTHKLSNSVINDVRLNATEVYVSNDIEFKKYHLLRNNSYENENDITKTRKIENDIVINNAIEHQKIEIDTYMYSNPDNTVHQNNMDKDGKNEFMDSILLRRQTSFDDVAESITSANITYFNTNFLPSQNNSLDDHWESYVKENLNYTDHDIEALNLNKYNVELEGNEVCKFEKSDISGLINIKTPSKERNLEIKNHSISGEYIEPLQYDKDKLEYDNVETYETFAFKKNCITANNVEENVRNNIDAAIQGLENILELGEIKINDALTNDDKMYTMTNLNFDNKLDSFKQYECSDAKTTVEKYFINPFEQKKSLELENNTVNVPCLINYTSAIKTCIPHFETNIDNADVSDIHNMKLEESIVTTIDYDDKNIDRSRENNIKQTSVINSYSEKPEEVKNAEGKAIGGNTEHCVDHLEDFNTTECVVPEERGSKALKENIDKYNEEISNQTALERSDVTA